MFDSCFVFLTAYTQSNVKEGFVMNAYIHNSLIVVAVSLIALFFGVLLGSMRRRKVLSGWYEKRDVRDDNVQMLYCVSSAVGLLIVAYFF